MLERNRCLISNQFMEADSNFSTRKSDIRLFTKIVRFDVAYNDAFKCKVATILHDYPALNRPEWHTGETMTASGNGQISNMSPL